MTITIKQAREALAAAVESGTGIVCSPHEGGPVNAPMCKVARREMDPRLVFSGATNAYNFTVTLYVGGLSDEEAEDYIDERCATSGDFSIKTAIENGDLWNVAVAYASVTQIGETNERAVGEVVYKVVDFDVEVCW